jgi:hypothetical protein
VDKEIQELRQDAATTRTGHDRAEIGRLCREVLVSVADTAYDEPRHGPLPERQHGEGGGTVTKRLEAVLATDAAGPDLADLRTLVRKVMSLANALQHRKDPSDTEAMILADATIMLARAVRRCVDAPIRR